MGPYLRARRVAGSTLRWVDARRPVAVRSTCYAPHSALYFRPEGTVKACCVSRYEVGRVTGPERSSLRDIWGGAALAAQRTAVEGGRFDLGCGECELAIAGGGRPASFAAHFDRWRRRVPLPFPTMLDFSLSNRCNLACVMCDGDLSSTIRAKREHRPPMPSAYDDEFFDQLAEFLPHVERVQFKGGEPFLAPENRRVWDLMTGLGVRCETLIVTNGTVWNDDVERTIRDLRADLTVSVDAVSPEVLESIRVGVRPDRLWANIDRFQALCGELGSTLTLNFCLMADNWQELPAFLAEVDRRRVGCYLIMVCDPARFDLLGRPADELAHVVEVLEPVGKTLTTPPTRRRWDEVMRRLRAAIDAAEPVERPVTVTRRSLADGG